MKSDELTATVEKLCQASTRDFINPYSYLDWPNELSKEQWFMSPELMSVYGTDIWNELSESQKMILSFYEAVNFFSLNIHGEKPLIEGLAHRLYQKTSNITTPYLHHFLDEENKHMVYFGGFCMKYAGKIYPNRKLSFPAEYEPGEEDFLFFAKVLMFEEIVDVYNVKMSLDERLVPIARQINLLHHKDEARHLVFGRRLVKEIFDTYASTWSAETLKRVRQYLADYLTATWKEYYNPDVFRDAGLSDPYDLAEQLFTSQQACLHRKRISSDFIRTWMTNGYFEQEPSL